MENEIPKTPEVKNAGVERNKIVDNRVYSFEKLIKTLRLPSMARQSAI